MNDAGGTALVGDIGGTNVRLALARLGANGEPHFGIARHYRTAALASLESAVEDFIAALPAGSAPRVAVIGVAGPVRDGRATLTNLPLTLTEDSLRALGFSEARLVNDFEALAHAVPVLPAEHLEWVGGPHGCAFDKGFVVLGAGTGFGVSCGLGAAECRQIAVTEGGHVSFAPTDEIEMEILRRLTGRFGRVSIERILSGPGLIALYDVFRALRGSGPAIASSHAIIEEAKSGAGLARDTVQRFVKIYGAVAGDFALAFGAQGGVFLAGGATRGLGEFLHAPEFRQNFEAKGRFRPYLEAIGTSLVVTDNAAHYGLARLAAERFGVGRDRTGTSGLSGQSGFSDATLQVLPA